MRKVKPFEPQEKGYVIIDNAVFDYIMPALSPNAWKVLCFIVRKTKGWNKKWDGLPYSQIREGTGIGSYATISRALSELLEKEYIKQLKGGKWDAARYALNTALEIEVENGLATETVVDTATETVVDTATETVDSILHETHETQLSPTGDNAPGSDRADSRSLTDLPEADKQVEILFAGRTNGNQYGIERAESLLMRSGWNIRSKQIKDAVIYCLAVTNWDLPPPGRRKLWEKDVRYQLDELHFLPADLVNYYALAYTRLADGTDRDGRPLTIPPHPGALTKTMEAIREERKRDRQAQEPQLEWEWKT